VALTGCPVASRDTLVNVICWKGCAVTWEIVNAAIGGKTVAVGDAPSPAASATVAEPRKSARSV
jgi:hypothetical protein